MSTIGITRLLIVCASSCSFVNISHNTFTSPCTTEGPANNGGTSKNNSSSSSSIKNYQFDPLAYFKDQFCTMDPYTAVPSTHDHFLVKRNCEDAMDTTDITCSGKKQTMIFKIAGKIGWTMQCNFAHSTHLSCKLLDYIVCRRPACSHF